MGEGGGGWGRGCYRHAKIDDMFTYTCGNGLLHQAFFCCVVCLSLANRVYMSGCWG